MKRALFYGVLLVAFGGWVVLPSYLLAQAAYPYSSGQAVFVQSPYTSSLYTAYPYDPSHTAPHRLPPYTTNQAVFVQKPYATAQQTVVSYPTAYANASPLTENRYTPATAFPSTVAPAYPFATTGGYPPPTYNTTSQSPTYVYPYSGTDYTTTFTYPYTTSSQRGHYQATAVESSPFNAGRGANPYAASREYPSATYVAYPVTIVQKYPYPTTTTAVPEIIVEPPKKKR